MRRKRAPQQSSRRVLDEGPLEVSLTVKYRGTADQAECGAAGVADHGIRRIPTRMSCQARPIRQIDVFVHHEEVIVEPAQVVEHLSSDREGRAARAKDFARGRIVGAARPCPRLNAPPARR